MAKRAALCSRLKIKITITRYLTRLPDVFVFINKMNTGRAFIAILLNIHNMINCVNNYI